MIKPESCIRRFIKTYGDISPFKDGLPCVVGKYRTTGLSFEPKTMYAIMLLKSTVQKIESLNPLDCLPELEYNVDNEIVSWSKEELIQGFRVLDTKPFQNLTVTMTQEKPLPLMITREDNIGVFLSPSIEKIPMFKALKEAKKKLTNYEIWHTGKLKHKWVNQFFPFSTLWLVELEDGTRIVKCKNCNFEMNTSDYYNNFYEKHRECTCTCSTYDCPMDCTQNRWRREYESKMRNLSNRKRFWRKKFT